MGLSDAEADAYASDVIRSDFEEAGDEDVVRKIMGDLTSAGVDVDDARIREALEHKTVEAAASSWRRRADADGGRRD